MIAVLGRGKSLLKYPRYAKKIQKLYIVNNFEYEIKRLGLGCFVGKEIIHVVGRSGGNVLSKKIYETLGIKKIQSNSFSELEFGKEGRYPVPVSHLPASMSKRGYPPIKWKKILEKAKGRSYKELMHILPKNYPKEKCIRGWPTTGLLAIDLALFTEKPKSLYLFGFDLYRRSYLVKKNAPYQNEENPKSKAMYYHLCQLVEEFSKCKFKCASPIKVSRPNWTNI